MSDRRQFLAGAVSSLALLWKPADAALSGLTVLPTSSAAVPTLIQHVGSTVNDNNGISGNGFVFSLPNVVGTGNCLILGISFPFSAGRTVSVVDSTGNTWTQAGSQVTDSTNMAQRIYVCPNASAALHTVTVTFDTTLRPFEYQISEFQNIATTSPVDGTHGTASVASPNVSAGSYTPTTNNDANGGHLIWTFTRSNDTVGTINANAASAIAPTGSQLLLSADNTCTIPGACSYYVQATNGAINPGFTITQSSGTNFVCSSVALLAANAGTAPPAGIRIKRILHATYVLGGSSAVFCVPTDGNLILGTMPAGNNLNPISTVTDSNLQSYSNPGTAGNPQLWMKQNATPSNGLKITFTSGVSTQFSVRFFDIVGAQTSSFLNTSGVNGANPATGNLSLSWTITPNSAPGLTISVMGYGTGPGTGMGTGSPSGSVFDLVVYPGETDQDRLDNADATSHVNYSTTATQTNIYAIGNASRSSTAFGTAACFA